jgi:uncharacterized protein YndB with AHSA1/START domain
MLTNPSRERSFLDERCRLAGCRWKARVGSERRQSGVASGDHRRPNQSKIQKSREPERFELRDIFHGHKPEEDDMKLSTAALATALALTSFAVAQSGGGGGGGAGGGSAGSSTGGASMSGGTGGGTMGTGGSPGTNTSGAMNQGTNMGATSTNPTAP